VARRIDSRSHAQLVPTKSCVAGIISKHCGTLRCATNSAATIGACIPALRGRRGMFADMLNSLLLLLLAIGLGEALALPRWASRSGEPAPGRPAGWAGGVASRSRLAEAAAVAACIVLRGVG
jgi:hypothetical protein